jgi:two-component system sensor histidine kinase VanS
MTTWPPAHRLRIAWRPRFTIRTRLTLIYGGLFSAAGTALLAIVYLLMSSSTYQFGNAVPPAPGVLHQGDAASSPNPGAYSGVPAAPAVGHSTISSESDLLHGLLQASALAMLVGTVAALGLGWFVAGRALRPMSRITAAAAGIAARNLHERVGLTGPDDEVKELADTFDGMLARLEAAFDTQRRFAANASHELLTPLATSRVILQLAAARPDACDVTALTGKLLAANRRSEQIVEALLTLARADHGAVQRRSTDLAVVLGEAVERTSAEAARLGVTVHTDLAPAVLPADPALLGQLADNMLHNAIRHNHPGGQVTATVDTSPSGTSTLTVSNTGPQVDPDTVDRLFEPFFRLDARTNLSGRSGHGLGMAIIRAVTEAHDGTVTAHPNPDGGLTVTTTFAPAPDHLPPPPRPPRSRSTGS